MRRPGKRASSGEQIYEVKETTDGHELLVPVEGSQQKQVGYSGWAAVGGLIQGFFQASKWLVLETRQLRAGLSGRRGYKGALISSGVAALFASLIIFIVLAALLPPPVIVPLVFGVVAVSLLNVARRASINLARARSWWQMQLGMGALAIIAIPGFAYAASTVSGENQILGALVLAFPLGLLWQRELIRYRSHSDDLIVAALIDGEQLEEVEDDEVQPQRRADGAQFEPLAMPSEPAPLPSEVIEDAEPLPPEPIEDILADLDQMVGLEIVKEQVRNWISRTKMDQEREQHGLKARPMSLNVLFLGPPGTGKTSVASIIARVYHSLGMLPSSDVVKANVSGFVGQVQGESEAKTNEILDRSIGKTLFGDEIYGLVTSEQDDFGLKALSILVDRIEEERTQRAVIFAGYEGKMARFFEKNEGLESRFPKSFTFESFTGEQLVEIFRRDASRFDYEIADAAAEWLHQLFNEIQSSNASDKFANARGVRNLVDESIDFQGERLQQQDERGAAEHQALTLADVKAAWARYEHRLQR